MPGYEWALRCGAVGDRDYFCQPSHNTQLSCVRECRGFWRRTEHSSRKGRLVWSRCVLSPSWVRKHREINFVINLCPSLPLSSQERQTLECVLKNGTASLELTSSHSVHRTTETSPEAGGQQSNATSKSLAVECEIPLVLRLPAPGCLLVRTMSGSLDQLCVPALLGR